MADQPSSIKELKAHLLELMEAELAPVYARQDAAFDVISECSGEIDAIMFRYRMQGLSPKDIAERVNAVPNTIYSRLKRHKDRMANDDAEVVGN